MTIYNLKPVWTFSRLSLKYALCTDCHEISLIGLFLHFKGTTLVKFKFQILRLDTSLK